MGTHARPRVDYQMRGSLCERRGPHVTLSSSLPCRYPTAFPFERFKEPLYRFKKICPPASPVEISKKFDGELCGPTTVSPLQVGPPAHRELAPKREH